MAVTPAVDGTSAVSVLVVDDNAAKRTALRAVLRPLGYRIVEADSGVAALRCLMDNDFAVILLDVRMPVMDGFETAALVRKRVRSEMTPIIFVTAYGSDELLTTERYAEGAVDFMHAPIDPDELRSKVTAFARLFARDGRLEEHTALLGSGAEELKLLIDSAPIGIFRTDNDGKIVYVNPQWVCVTGITSAAAVGRRWTDLVEQDEGLDMQATDADAEPRLQVRRSGEQTDFLVSSRPIMADPDGAVGYISILVQTATSSSGDSAVVRLAAGWR